MSIYPSISFRFVCEKRLKAMKRKKKGKEKIQNVQLCVCAFVSMYRLLFRIYFISLYRTFVDIYKYIDLRLYFFLLLISNFFLQFFSLFSFQHDFIFCNDRKHLSESKKNKNWKIDMKFNYIHFFLLIYGH